MTANDNQLDDVSRLRTTLATVPPGEVHENRREEVLNEVSKCWPMLYGEPLAAKMNESKVCRGESLKWHPPTLSFIIERHGAAALGSKRAELQLWTIDVERGMASF